MDDLTHKAIKESFFKLLNERSLDKISVKDIVEDWELARILFIIIIWMFMICLTICLKKF